MWPLVLAELSEWLVWWEGNCMVQLLEGVSYVNSLKCSIPLPP